MVQNLLMCLIIYLRQTHPHLIGSTSIVANPEHNSVMESIIKTIKFVMNNDEKGNHSFQFPDTIPTTQQLQTLLNNRIRFYNNQYKPACNSDLTPVQKEEKAKVTKIIQPEVLLTKRDPHEPLSQPYTEIVKYHKDLVDEPFHPTTADS